MNRLSSKWTTSRLGDLCSVVTGKRDVNEGAPDGKYPFFTCAQEVYRINFCPFDGESILIAGNGFFNVKYFIGKFDAYQRTYVLQNFGINGRYLYRYIQHKLVDITKDNRGSTINYIRLGDLTDHVVPVAPLGEQRRIVAKLEKLLDRVDACHNRLAKIPIILKRFRQSVLAAACSGRLTADWREENQDVEFASKYVCRIQIERKTIYERQCTDAISKGQRKPKRPKNEFTANLVDDVNGLPTHWCVTRIGDICDCLDHLRVPVNKTVRLSRKGNIPYYGANGQVGWIDDFLFDEELVLVVEDETFIGREKPFSYVIRGKAWVNNHAHVLRPLSKMSVDYLNICLSYYDFTPLTSGTTGRRKLNQDALMEAPLWIAPLSEQQEIVRRVQSLFALADKIEARFQKAQAQIEKLTPSILAKAFRGELVPQDPRDEPASVLLERIKTNQTTKRSLSRTKKTFIKRVKRS